MTRDRAVAWGELHNVRDLGGLDGWRGTTRFERVFRSPRPDGLDAAGWAAVVASGVRTIVDLRNGDEVALLPLRPDVLAVRKHPIEDQGDQEFMAEWAERLSSPSYYSEALRRWPEMFRAAFAAIADAGDGGVLVHCSAGRDRTGLITAMLLSLADVRPGDILEDYEAGVRETDAFLRAMPAPFEPIRAPERFESDLADAGRDLEALLGTLDVERYLIDVGVTAEQIVRIRARLLE